MSLYNKQGVTSILIYITFQKHMESEVNTNKKDY